MVGDATTNNKYDGSRTMRVKNSKTPVKVLGASILCFVSQLAACGGTTDDTSVAEPGVKQLTEGQVTGIASPYDESITVYRGLPYAAPPVDDLRWRAPQAPADWAGVRSADTFADSCYQPRHSSTFVWRREDFPSPKTVFTLMCGHQRPRKKARYGLVSRRFARKWSGTLADF